jgi:hypothetical protein
MIERRHRRIGGFQLELNQLPLDGGKLSLLVPPVHVAVLNALRAHGGVVRPSAMSLLLPGDTHDVGMPRPTNPQLAF